MLSQLLPVLTFCSWLTYNGAFLSFKSRMITSVKVTIPSAYALSAASNSENDLLPQDIRSNSLKSFSKTFNVLKTVAGVALSTATVATLNPMQPAYAFGKLEDANNKLG